MTVVTTGVWKFVTLAGAFLSAGMAAPEQEQPPETQTVILPVAPTPPPVNIAPPPLPPADPVKTTFDNFHSAFLDRVAAGRQTAFNTCFTRTGNPVLPANVDMIRRASYSPQKVDYTLDPIIIIDPGHASEGDPGAIRGGLRETEVVNAVAIKLKSVLEQRGAEVVGTRAPVADITLNSRYRFKDQDRALQWRAELVYEFARKFPERPVIGISLHADTSTSATSRGAGVFYYAGSGAHSAPSADLARHIAAEYRTPAGRSMVKADNFAYPRCQEKTTPIVLVELGYLTNESDFTFLRAAVRNPDRAENIADRLADGIFGFVEQKRRQQAPTPPIMVAVADAPPVRAY